MVFFMIVGCWEKVKFDLVRPPGIVPRLGGAFGIWKSSISAHSYSGVPGRNNGQQTDMAYLA
jgi:hypothetical protein